jgi:ribulose-5-phosphate 4-epimerase/fuculose-1-phosphate aldolase
MASVNVNELKKKLIEAAVICEMEGLSDAFGHISVRIPGTDHILMTPQGPPGTAKRSGVIELNLKGEKVRGIGKPNTELPIHTCIYRVRDDVQSVLHVHSPKAVAFSVAGQEIYPLYFGDKRFSPSVKIFGDPGTQVYITTDELGEKMARALGQSSALMIRGHGVVTVGASIESACLCAIGLEKAAETQFIASILVTGQRKASDFQTALLNDLRGPEALRRDLRNWDFYHSKLRRYLREIK